MDVLNSSPNGLLFYKHFGFTIVETNRKEHQYSLENTNVSENHKGMGVGTALLKKLIHQSEEEDYWTLQSGIIKENIPSRMLHKKCGFREIGYRERPGKMSNGKWHDVILMERRSTEIVK